MHETLYPPGTVRALLSTASVTPATRQVLQARLARAATVTPRFFSSSAFATLGAVCARLIPPISGVPMLDIAGSIDEALAAGVGDGWRYDTMPPDALAFQQGLAGIDESAGLLFGAPFEALEPTQQDAVLQAIQAGNPPGTVWQTLPADRFFEELLAAAVQACYAHPLVQESIGYVGMADAPGWQTIGLNTLEAREPRPVQGLHG